MTFSKFSFVFDLCNAADDLMPGEYGACGPGLCVCGCDIGDPGYAVPFKADVDCLSPSSKYGELISARDSEAVVATDVRGACRLCARGTCCPVR